MVKQHCVIQCYRINGLPVHKTIVVNGYICLIYVILYVGIMEANMW